MFPPPELVYRRINFPDGVPDVYSWCGPTQEIREFGGCGIQRMTLDTWLMVVEQEKGFSDGRIGVRESAICRVRRSEAGASVRRVSGGAREKTSAISYRYRWVPAVLRQPPKRVALRPGPSGVVICAQPETAMPADRARTRVRFVFTGI